MRSAGQVASRATSRVVFVAALVCGCASPQVRLPSPPSDSELRNDGSATGQRQVEDRFSVVIDEDTAHVGRARRDRRPSFFPGAMPAVPDDVRAYLQSEPHAARELPSPALQWGHRAIVAATAASLVGWSILVVVPAFALAFVVFVFGVLRSGITTAANAYAGTTLGWLAPYAVFAVLAALLAVVAAPLGAIGIGGSFVRARVAEDALQREMKAAETFNTNLRARIEANSHRPQAAPPEGARR